MISPRSVQQVKDVVRIEEVLGEFLDLKRKGPRYLGLCPFHNEKTPSFNVSPSLGIYKCFGCGESGDAITFLQKQEHLSFAESIRWLAKRYNIELEEEEQSPEQQLEQSERESLAVVQQWAVDWSVDQLWNTEEGRTIGLAYFRERGVRDEVIRQFQLGYVPEQGAAFAKAALAHGFTMDALEKAGWIKLREDGAAWDFFQGRVTFPILGLTGQPIAFGARTLRSDKKLPKYFNSPESVLYNKSRSLYGIAFARKAIADKGSCCLVEGYMDVISLHQAGITNAVASSGTSLTQDQVRLIKRYATAVTILYDGDPAGIKASMRGIDIILAEGLSAKVVLFPEGEDPDSFARTRSSGEVEAFIAANARDFLVFKADMLMRETGGDPVRKAAAIHELVESLALIGDHVLRSLYVKQCAAMLELAEQALVSELNKVLRRNHRKKLGGNAPLVEEVLPPAIAPPQPEVEDPGTRPQERDLMRILLNYGHEKVLVPLQYEDGSVVDAELTVGQFMFDELAKDDLGFDDQLLHAIYLDYRKRCNLGEQVTGALYANHADEAWRSVSIDLLTEKHVLSPNWRTRHRIHVAREHDQLLDSLLEGLDILKERRVDRMIGELMQQLKDCAEDDMPIILDRIRKLTAVKMDFSKRTGRVVVG